MKTHKNILVEVFYFLGVREPLFWMTSIFSDRSQEKNENLWKKTEPDCEQRLWKEPVNPKLFIQENLRDLKTKNDQY